MEIKAPRQEPGLPGLELQVCALLVMWPWASCSVSPCLNFLICRLEILKNLLQRIIMSITWISMYRLVPGTYRKCYQYYRVLLFKNSLRWMDSMETISCLLSGVFHSTFGLHFQRKLVYESLFCVCFFPLFSSHPFIFIFSQQSHCTRVWTWWFLRASLNTIWLWFSDWSKWIHSNA